MPLPKLSLDVVMMSESRPVTMEVPANFGPVKDLIPSPTTTYTLTLKTGTGALAEVIVSEGFYNEGLCARTSENRGTRSTSDGSKLTHPSVRQRKRWRSSLAPRPS